MIWNPQLTIYFCISAKLAAAYIKRRIETKEPKVILLSLEVLDLAMQKCGNPLHVQIGNKDFMNVMVLLLNQKNQPPQVS
jgi:hypothetical protein